MLAADQVAVVDDDVAAVRGLRQAISALQADELEDAALLLPAVEAFVATWVPPANLGDPAVAALTELWREVVAEAGAGALRLRARLQQRAVSVRTTRAYTGGP